MDIILRSAKEEDLHLLCDMMRQEDWNADIRLLRSDLRCHPGEIIVAEENQGGKVVGMIMGLLYGTQYGFGCGFLVAAPYRGKGIGRLLWQERMLRMAGRNWAVDAVPERIEANIKKGFNSPQMKITAYRWKAKPQDVTDNQTTCCILPDEIMDEFIAYDAKTHPGGERGVHLKEFIKVEGFSCTVALEGGSIYGYVITYPGDNNMCVGILKADTVHVADYLLADLSDKLNGDFSIQIPSLNQNADVLIKKYQMTEWYTLHRMWMGKQPDIDYSQVYAVPQSAI